MIKVFFFGTGTTSESILSQINKMPENMDILGFLDNDSSQWGRVIFGMPVYSPQKIHEVEFDKLIIMSDDYYEDIKESLIYWHHVEEEKIESMLYLIKMLLIEKYGDSEDVEIKETLKYWETNQISIYNQNIKRNNEAHIVYWDCIENMPYIIFEDKRMYFPYDYKFQVVDGKKVVVDILGEQQPTSPHLYIKDDIKIEYGDVVVDAGVQEGNFALRYVEKASKMYLFEADRHWKKPLLKTFEKFKDKVILYDKQLGRFNELSGINLDTAINGRLDFLKMDIEGSETQALLGARNTLLNNNVKCSVCSYHKSGDEMAIKDVFRAYGYKTSNSTGYMLYYLHRDFYSTLDFRRGIVYAQK